MQVLLSCEIPAGELQFLKAQNNLNGIRAKHLFLFNRSITPFRLCFYIHCYLIQTPDQTEVLWSEAHDPYLYENLHYLSSSARAHSALQTYDCRKYNGSPNFSVE